MKTDIERLQETLNEMPYIFTSHEFCAVARKKGIAESDILKGRCANFYKKHTILKYTNPKRWQKINANPVFKPEQIKHVQLTEKEAIEFLKSKGYKFMIKISEWREV